MNRKVRAVGISWPRPRVQRPEVVSSREERTGRRADRDPPGLSWSVRRSGSVSAPSPCPHRPAARSNEVPWLQPLCLRVLHRKGITMASMKPSIGSCSNTLAGPQLQHLALGRGAQAARRPTTSRPHAPSALRERRAYHRVRAPAARKSRRLVLSARSSQGSSAPLVPHQGGRRVALATRDKVSAYPSAVFMRPEIKAIIEEERGCSRPTGRSSWRTPGDRARDAEIVHGSCSSESRRGRPRRRTSGPFTSSTITSCPCSSS